MRTTRARLGFGLGLAMAFLLGSSVRANIIEGFDSFPSLPGSGWAFQNNSSPLGLVGYFQGNDTVFTAQAGAPDAYLGVNFNSVAGAATISNWAITPVQTYTNGSIISFYSRTVDTPLFADRLEVRLSTNGSSANVGTLATDVGDFTTLLLTINPSLTTVGYPNVWTQFNATITGLGGPTSGRVAFRYFVTDGGPSGSNSDYIGIDTLNITLAAIPEPSPLLLAGLVGVPALLIGHLRRRRAA